MTAFRIPVREIVWRGFPASYHPHEVRFVRGIIAQYEAGTIDAATCIRQVEIIHGLKAVLGATMLEDDGKGPEAPSLW